MLPLLCCALLYTFQVPPSPSHTHGNMVGDVTASSAVVWTRADRSCRVSCFVSARPDLAGAVTVGPVTTGGGLTAQLQVTGLLPDTMYWFRTRLTDPSNGSLFEDGPIGSFRTAPTSAQGVMFTVGAEAADGPPGPIFPAMAALNPRFHVSLGDVPYCDGAVTLAEFRARHEVARKGLDLVQFFRHVPCFAVIDDHEVANDWDAGTNPFLVANGRAAWFEWFPLRALSPGVIYRSFAWGTAVRVILLDTRTYRGRNLAPDLPGRSLLGATQMAWLKQELLAAQETFVVVASTVPLRYGKTLKDHWEGFQHDRREVFDFLQQNQLHHVVFVTGDMHHGAFHFHREGWLEMVVGPARAFPAVPHEDREPEARVATIGLGFGTVAVDPAATPPTLTLELRDAQGVLAREVFRREAPGALHVVAGDGDATVALEGPHFFLHQGDRTEFPQARPGIYTVSARPIHAVAGIGPAPVVTVPSGGFASVGVLPAVTAGSRAQLLLREDFSAPGPGLPPGFTVVDEGIHFAPSAWFVDNGQLWQSSDIFSVDPPRPGTHVVAGNASWTDQVVRVQIRPHGYLAHGVLFRYRNPGNYYLFWQDLAGPLRALYRRANGVLTLLASDNRPYAIQHTLNVECQALADQLQVRMDGEPILSARDGTHATGRVGLALWGSSLTAFDQLRVWSAPPDEGPLFSDTFPGPGMGAGWTAFDDGNLSAPSSWRVANGRLVQTSPCRGAGASRPGTRLLRLSPVCGDAAFSAYVKALDQNGVGVLFRVQSPGTYYRFHMAADFLRLDKFVNGNWSVVAEDLGRGFEREKLYRVDCVAQGDRLQIFLDRELVLAARDQDIQSGGVGLYTFGTASASFDRVAVHALAGESPVTTLSGSGRTFQVDFHVPGAAGSVGVVLFSRDYAPGIDLTGLDPLGRLLPLSADLAFQVSLSINAWTRFDAADHAPFTLSFPGDPGLTGLRLLVGGVRVDPGLTLRPLASAPVELR